jgi:tetratricopeptide (TPR) repeat protein
LQPDAAFYNNLAGVYRAKGQPDAVEAALRKAIELKPDLAETHFNLATMLQSQAKLEQALVEFRRFEQLISQNPRLRSAYAHYIRQCERFLELDRKLRAIDNGEMQPADAAGRVELARLCQECKQRFAASTRFFEEAFAAEPALADDHQKEHRYNAACAAAMAGCGQGKDAGALGDKERTRLRQQALRWLRDDLKAWQEKLNRDPGKVRTVVVRTLQRWLVDTDFATVRSPEGLARLPETEQQTWQAFWVEVQRLLDQAQATPPAATQRKP